MRARRSDAGDGDSAGEHDAEENEEHRGGAIENALEGAELGEKHSGYPIFVFEHPAGVASYLDGA